MRLSKKGGFTIVELLIVVVVIAILAAITIVSYNGISNRAKASAAVSLTAQVYKKVLLYAATNSDLYPASLSDINIFPTDGKTYGYSVNTSTNPQGFCLTTTNSGFSAYAANNFTYTDTSTQTLDQAAPVAGACPGHSSGGQVAITNRALSPRGAGANEEWLSRYGQARTWISGAVDGPTAGLNSYSRFTQNSAVTGGGRGVDHLINIDIVTPSVTTAWPVPMGQPVVASIYTRSSVSNSSLKMTYRIHNGNGSWLAYGSCSATNYTAGPWVRVLCNITPSTTGYLAVSTRYNDTVTWSVGSTIDATGLMLTNGDSLHAYADGNSPGWVWTGTMNNSHSMGPSL